MGAIVERLQEIARRCGDLTPLAEPVRQLIVEDNRDAILNRQDCRGNTVASLAASTLRTRDGSGPERAPNYSRSRIIRGLVVWVRAGVGQLSFTKSWPDAPWVEHHVTGTPKMPARDPSGVRPGAMDEIRAMLKGHVKDGDASGRRGWWGR
jgi:hypothetical protein